MNSMQFFGVLAFSLGIILYLVGTISVFFAGEAFIGPIFGFATIACFVGPVIILISLVGERLRDSKKDKRAFSKWEGIK